MDENVTIELEPEVYVEGTVASLTKDGAHGLTISGSLLEGIVLRR